MYYKLFNEEGKWKDKTTGELKNIMEVNWAWTPEGDNVGWDFFDTIEEAMTYYNIEIIKEDEINN
jgi:hypothetical protein